MQFKGKIATLRRISSLQAPLGIAEARMFRHLFIQHECLNYEKTHAYFTTILTGLASKL